MLTIARLSEWVSGSPSWDLISPGTDTHAGPSAVSPTTPHQAAELELRGGVRVGGERHLEGQTSKPWPFKPADLELVLAS